MGDFVVGLDIVSGKLGSYISVPVHPSSQGFDVSRRFGVRTGTFDKKGESKE